MKTKAQKAAEKKQREKEKKAAQAAKKKNQPKDEPKTEDNQVDNQEGKYLRNKVECILPMVSIVTMKMTVRILVMARSIIFKKMRF